MLGSNKKEGVVVSDGRHLFVNEMFHSIQGEGPFAGQSAIFIRLAGCNLACEWCDTEFEERYDASVDFIMQFVAAHNTSTDLVVITGGEPMRQNIVQLVYDLLHDGMRVQIETAGTLWPEGMPIQHSGLTIVCCPKTPAVHPMIADNCCHWKYVLEADSISRDGLPSYCPTGAKGIPFRPPKNRPGTIYVMPCDRQDDDLNRLNYGAVAESAITFGYRAGLQIHKILMVR